MKIYVVKISWGGIKPNTEVYLFKTLEKAEEWIEEVCKMYQIHNLDIEAEITIEEKLLWN